MARNTITSDLMSGDWQDKTLPEIAEALHIHQESVKSGIRYIRRKYGFTIPYRRRQRGRKRVSHEQT